MTEQPTSNPGVYVYCVAPAPPFAGGARFEVTGIGDQGNPVRTVAYEDLVAIVSDSPKQRYELTREYLLGHERVLEEAMKRADLLPVAYSTVARSDHEIREKLLRRRFDELHRYLEDVRDRRELDLKVLWNRERLFAEVVAENTQIRALQESIASQSEDASYYDRIQIGELTEESINLKHAEESDAILRVLAPLAVDTKVNKTYMEMMILNAAFLVDKNREAEFDAAVRALGETNQGRLILQYVGPLPPYNFVNLQVRWED
jgi:hypothetical protein